MRAAVRAQIRGNVPRGAKNAVEDQEAHDAPHNAGSETDQMRHASAAAKSMNTTVASQTRFDGLSSADAISELNARSPTRPAARSPRPPTIAPDSGSSAVAMKRATQGEI